MTQFIIGSIYNFDFKERFILQGEVMSINFLNAHTNTEALIDHSYFLKGIGEIEKQEMLRSSLHFSQYSFDSEGATKSEAEQLAAILLAIQKYQTQTLLISLWLIKDNSVNTSNFFYFDSEREHIIRDSPTILFSSSKGEYIQTSFSEEEIKQAMEWQKKVIQYPSKKKNTDEDIKHIMGSVNSINNFDKRSTAFEADRISRALKMTTIARSQSFLPAKIASYISAIEALISSNREALTMQVCERVPRIIGENKGDKIIIHDQLRDAYNIRSKYVHGDKVSERIAQSLEEISENIDGILRGLLIKVIKDHEEIKDFNEKSMTKWYKENFMF